MIIRVCTNILEGFENRFRLLVGSLGFRKCPMMNILSSLEVDSTIAGMVFYSQIF